MQVSEFKAWFEGFTEDMTKLPTVKQWSRIKARIDEIDGVPTTERYFRDFYWRPYAPHWPQTTWISTTLDGTHSGTDPALTTSKSVVLNVNQVLGPELYRFTALGKAEAVSVAA